MSTDLPLGSLEVSRITIITFLTSEGDECDLVDVSSPTGTTSDLKGVLGSLSMAADTLLEEARTEDLGDEGYGI